MTVDTAVNINPQLGDVSNRYVVINSRSLVEALEDRGFTVFKVMRARKNSGKHIIRMRSAEPFTVNGETLFPEIVIHNSYDGKSKFSVEVGIFRLICANGLTIKDKDFGSYTCRHIGTPAEIAQDITMKFLESLEKVSETCRKLAAVELTEEQAIEYAMKAAKARWNKAFTAEQAAVLLTAARPEDDTLNLWHVYNTIQENLLTNPSVKPANVKRLVPITQPARFERVNTELFELAYAYAN